MGIGFSEMIDEIGYEVGGNRGQYTDAQAAVHTVGFVGYYLFDALGLVQGHLCLPDNLFSDAGGGDILPVTVENLDVEFLFQFLNHCAEGGLCHPTGFGGKYEVAVFVEGHDVFHLLQGHGSIDFINTKIGKICCAVSGFLVLLSQKPRKKC